MFQEFYYWMCFYVRKVKINKEPEWNAYMLLSILRILNIGGILGILLTQYPTLKGDGFTIGKKIIVIFFALALNWVDWNLFYKRREKIFTRINKFGGNERMLGKIKFWIYVTVTFLICFLLLPWLQGTL